MSWLKQIENLKPGDPCEFRWPARKSWRKGKVLVNGGSGYWKVEITESYNDEENNEPILEGDTVECLYIEHIRPVGCEEAWASPTGRLNTDGPMPLHNMPVPAPPIQGFASESALEAGTRIHQMLEDRLTSIPGELVDSTVNPLVGVVHDSVEIQTTAGPPPTAMELHKALRAGGLTHEQAKETTLKAARVDELIKGIRRLLEYPLHLIVRRSDVRMAARLAGVQEPPWPVSDTNMNTRVLLDKELLRQQAVIKQLIHDYAYGQISLYTLCHGTGVVTQEWMKEKKIE